jgi:hypothetical protein
MTTIASDSVVHQFGFFTMEVTGIGWVAMLRNVQGGSVVRCRLVTGAATSCSQ